MFDLFSFLLGVWLVGMIYNYWLYRERKEFNRIMKENIEYYNKDIAEHWKLLEDLGEAFHTNLHNLNKEYNKTSDVLDEINKGLNDE